MANADVIAKGLIELEEAADQFEVLMDVLLDVGGDRCPPWVALMSGHLDRIAKAVEAHGAEVRQRVLPLLKDFERVKGGMGAVAPMVTSGGVPDRPGTQAKANGVGKSLAQANSNASSRK